MNRKIILFQGDSITDGNRLKDYPSDLNHQIGHGYPYVIVGRLGAEHPQAGLQFVNRGISGNTVQNLSDRWQKDCLDICPDVLNILVGVNDVHYSVFDGKDFCIEKIKETYKSLIDRVREVNLEVKIILCEPFNFAIGSPGKEWDTWYPRLVQVQQTVRDIAEEKGTFFLPLQQMFNDLCQKAEPSCWLWDGIHPTESGHWMIAKAWLDLVEKNNILGLDA